MTSNKIKSIIIKTLVSTLIILLVYIGGKFYLNNKYNAKNLIPKPKTEYKVDMTEFKIKQILNTFKIESMEVECSSTINSKSFKSFNIKYIDSISKLLTSKELNLGKDFKGLFLYDISKSQFKNNLDGTYTITFNTSDVSVEIVDISSSQSSEKKDLMGYGFTVDEALKLSYQLNTMAKQKLFTDDNRIKTLDNARLCILNSLKQLGIDTNKINIVIMGGN